ncbi:transglycosylase SLT domain-containing protein [Niveispirillum sp.]|uniref:transglycosylase SLT domain-containing protein n=1 Tax=Niveispirillum sp. TaxID=1917217 RepID=UPI001B53827E|nr:transglycosylase SLT domain-containing protein [Niveispirillum sp.]MBP7337181.1 transglycosylase SLT domain-containing protein [Niveispirillum sp.]
MNFSPDHHRFSRRALLATAVAGLGLACALPARAFTLSGTIWEETGQLAGLDPYLLYAVSYVESRQDRKGRTGPWPYAVRTARESHFPEDFTAAVNLIHRLPAEEVKDADLGWMQVNVRWHGHRVPDISHLLHAEINLRVGAGILREALDSLPDDPALAVGRYHTWMDVPRARDYGERVLALRQRLRAA